MAHENKEQAKASNLYKLRSIVGSDAPSEHFWDKGHRLAYEDRRVVGNPSPPEQAEGFTKTNKKG